jgi:Tol biopolymer transport system component
MSLTAGTRLGTYEIKDSLGAGGMGEVYRARDTKLHREVAIKVLPAIFAGDPDRLGRFEREAHTLAALNHPNIAQIYGLEGSALVMELVDGEDLAARLARGPFPVDEMLSVARQLADALDAAHDHGIVHRDLKPANVKIRADGTVKVLDFGLAKAVGHPEIGMPNPTGMLPTITSPAMTHAGVILGTAAYMAPAQARGQPVDKRADIWALGCVLYELLTGRRAFGGDNVTDTIAAVVRGEPDWTLLPGDTPASIRRLLRRCLEKDRKRRLADAADARLEIESAQSPAADDAGIVAAPQHARRLAVPIGATAIVALLAGASMTWLATRSAPQAARAVRLQAAFPAQTTLSMGPIGSEVAIAPDGSRILYVGQAAPPAPPQLFVRSLDSGETSPIVGTEYAQAPFFSPDGEMVAFVRDGSLLKIGARGGSPTTICAGCAPGFYGGAWTEDDTIVFARSGGGGGLLRLRQDGQISQVTEIDRAAGESRHGYPSILPGGQVLFMIHPAGNVAPDIAVLDPKAGTRRVIVRGGGLPSYVPPGFLVFATEGALNAVRFDLSRFETAGTPVPVLDRVITKTPRGANYAVSRNGSLVYASGDPIRLTDTIAWVGRDGHEETIRVQPHLYVMPRVSPDGQYVVLDARDEEMDLFLWDFKSKDMQRLTSEPGQDGYPVWSRNQDRRLYLNSGAVGERGLFRMDLPRAPERLTKSGPALLPTTISPDGKWLVGGGGPQGVGLTMISTETGHETRPLPGTAAGAANADISPDGEWIAYQSSASGRSEIYVHPFPDTAAFRRLVGQGTRPLWSPVWSPAGGELFYLDADRRLMSLPVATKPTFSIRSPTKLLDKVPVITPGRSYDVSPDGKRFLILKDAPGASQSIRQLEVVLNWTEDLRRLTQTTK